MPMSVDNIEQLMIRYLQEACSEGEKILFESWLQESEDNRRLFYEIKQLWFASKIDQFRSQDQLETALRRFTENVQQSQLKKHRKIFPMVARYAAALIGVAIISWIFLLLVQKKENSTEWLTTSVAQTDSSRMLVLGDGTRVWLNSNSKLKYPATFSGNDRTVSLSGEAFFEVTHDAAHPFIVQTNSVNIRVLGTAFNLNAYPDNTFTEAMLVRGSIAVQDSSGKELGIVKPLQLAVFNKINRHFMMKEADTAAYVGWRSGQVIFDGADLASIARRLAELYQVNCTVSTTLSDTTRYNFTFSRKNTVTEVLEMLSFIAPVRYEIQGNNITLFRK